MSLEIGEKLPKIRFVATNHLEGLLSDLPNKNILIYFYPKDNTPGCTNEAKDFRDLYNEFTNANTLIYGVSLDSLSSHEKFKAKWELPFELISDHDETIAKHFGVIREKLLFGRKYFGIIRSSFLFDSEGLLRHSWPRVSIKGHAAEVLKAAQNIKNQ
jgi:peroxiredoxin Q/BCP